MSKIKAIAAPIFEKYPNIHTVYVVDKYGFVTLNNAKLHAAGIKKIHKIEREGAVQEPELTQSFSKLNKAELIGQGTLRGMTLSSDDSKAKLIEQLEAYDANLKRPDEPEVPNENGNPQSAEGIAVNEPENVE